MKIEKCMTCRHCLPGENKIFRCEVSRRTVNHYDRLDTCCQVPKSRCQYEEGENKLMKAMRERK